MADYLPFTGSNFIPRFLVLTSVIVSDFDDITTDYFFFSLTHRRVDDFVSWDQQEIFLNLANNWFG